MTSQPTRAVVVLGIIGALSATAVPAASAAPAPQKYSSCAKLNKVYPHGVGLKGAKDKVVGNKQPVRNFFVDSRTYKLNKAARDRDNDGIACEKV